MASELEFLPAGTVAELAKTGHKVVHGPDRPIVVFYNDGNITAIENRCPHMGFPLHRGTCSNGIVTCPWHHARFDAQSGSTFDMFAGDAAPFDVQVRGEAVFVSAYPRKSDVVANAKQRLREGLETNNSLVSSKAILTLRQSGSDIDVYREASLFGVQYRDEWGGGLTSLVALANLAPHLSENTGFLSLYQSVRRVSADSAGQAPRRERYPLGNSDVTVERLRQWMADWIDVRHRDGAERTILTAVDNKIPQSDLAALFLDGATQRVYADGGHVVDFTAKAFEVLDVIGWEHADKVLVAVLNRMVNGRGGDESTAWRTPVDLIAIVESLDSDLPKVLAQPDRPAWNDIAGLAASVLAQDPNAIDAALRGAAAAGATAEQMAKAVANAAAVRVAQFHTSNEFTDWLTVLHTFSYCHGAHSLVRRTSDPNAVRAVTHGAFSVYLDRFLNVPAQRLPVDLGGLPTDSRGLIDALLGSFDQRAENDYAARLVARYYDQGHELDALIDALTLAVAQEDADFHTIQMVEAAVQEALLWSTGDEQRTLFIAAARFLAAHAPTRRTQLQTAKIALRLHRGERMFEEDEIPA